MSTIHPGKLRELLACLERERRRDARERSFVEDLRRAVGSRLAEGIGAAELEAPLREVVGRHWTPGVGRDADPPLWVAWALQAVGLAPEPTGVRSGDGVEAPLAAADGEAACSEVDGQAAIGQAANGPSANGPSANGHSASGEAADGEAADGEAADGEAATGASATGASASGESPRGEAPSCVATTSEPADGAAGIGGQGFAPATKAAPPVAIDGAGGEVEAGGEHPVGEQASGGPVADHQAAPDTGAAEEAGGLGEGEDSAAAGVVSGSAAPSGARAAPAFDGAQGAPVGGAVAQPLPAGDLVRLPDRCKPDPAAAAPPCLDGVVNPVPSAA